jgi:hypothetical protein
MNKFIVETINDLSGIYTSIQDRIRNGEELLESDVMFIKFYNKFINNVFDVEKRRKMLND